MRSERRERARAMEVSPVECGVSTGKFKSDEAIVPPQVGDKLLSNKRDIQIRPLQCRSPDNKSTPKFYLPQGSPVLEVKSRFTFGTTECLHSGEPRQIAGQDGLVRTSSVSQQLRDVAENIPKTVPFGRSRRMSRSLPELRDLQFVSVLQDVEEEEDSETSEYQEEVVCEKPKRRQPWHRKLDFLWCSVCQALGLSNIWRFPYYCYSNGGGEIILSIYPFY